MYGRTTCLFHILQEWLNKRAGIPSRKPAYVKTRDELIRAVQDGATDILGLFGPLYLAWGAEKNATTRQTQPTLAEMVDAAITVLQTNKNGFLLFVESGQIDWVSLATLSQNL
jgi:alkaline phosphatase